jgi:hypothetical protein
MAAHAAIETPVVGMKNGDSIISSNWRNDGLTMDQRELEFKLEQLVTHYNALACERMSDRCCNYDSNYPFDVQIPKLRKFRIDRDYCLRSLSQVPFPRPKAFDVDAVDTEV